jgi:hypothetical protein
MPRARKTVERSGQDEPSADEMPQAAVQAQPEVKLNDGVEKMSDPFATNGVDGASVFADLEAIKAPLDDTVETAEALADVRVGKPDKKSFVRVHPKYSLPLSLVEVEAEGRDRATYLVMPAARQALSDYAKTCVLVLAVTRQGRTFVWPTPAPGLDNPWHKTHRHAAEQAKFKWVQMLADKANGSYKVKTAEAEWPEPEWRTETFEEILAAAFGDRIIRNTDHPVAKLLLGLA